MWSSQTEEEAQESALTCLHQLLLFVSAEHPLLDWFPLSPPAVLFLGNGHQIIDLQDRPLAGRLAGLGQINARPGTWQPEVCFKSKHPTMAATLKRPQKGGCERNHNRISDGLLTLTNMSLPVVVDTVRV